MPSRTPEWTSRHRRKRNLLLLGAAVAVLAGLALALHLGAGFLEPRLQGAASRATGLDVRIDGKVALSFFPLGVSAEQVHLSNQGTELGSVERLTVRVDLLHLLRKKLRVTRLVLLRPAIHLVRNAAGHLDLAGSTGSSPPGRPATALALNDLTLVGGEVTYLNEKTGERTELRGLDLALHDLLVPDTAGDILRSTSFEGHLQAAEVRRGSLLIGKVESQLKMEHGLLHLTHLTMDVFGSKGEGEALADGSGAEAVYGIDLKVSNLDFALLEKSFGVSPLIGGRGELQASLVVKEKKDRTLLRGLNGTFSLRGDGLTTYTVDLDKVLTKFEASQQFHLVDLGAFFIAGPLGVVALKGYGYGKVLSQAQDEGQGTITKFISHWKIRDGVAEATDCALATRHHRVALAGSLDLVEGRYREGAVVALLDDKGCARRQQSIGGPLSRPQVGATGVAGSLAGPVTDLFDKAKRFARRGECQVFYRGAVPQPPG